MVVGVPREIKKEEYRVGLTPEGVSALVRMGHELLIESGAGEGSGFTDGGYSSAGAIISDKKTVFEKSGLIVKVKEPLPGEFDFFREGQALFTFLHLAPNPGLTRMLLEKKITAFAYETLQDGPVLPILRPMSSIAGGMAPLVGAFYLQRPRGGSGVFPGRLAGVPAARCLVLGAGNVGRNAVRAAAGIGMRVTVMYSGPAPTLEDAELLPYSREALAGQLQGTDLVICAVLVTGAKTPVLITRDMLRAMRKGSVVVDVSVDQGGCLETTRPTTHADPVYVEEGVIHYAVANMPGAYPRTSTIALAGAALPYIKELLQEGAPEAALARSEPLRSALNTYKGMITHPALALSIGARPARIETLL